jgi:hypothetical protein
MVSYESMTTKATSLIKRRGSLGKLRRAGIPDRNCYCVITDYSPRERGLRNEGARRALISVEDPATGAYMAIPPNHEVDTLVYAGEVLRIPTPVEGARPLDKFLYFELEVVYDSREV